MRIYTGLIFALLVSCGSGSSDESAATDDCKKAEVDIMSLTPDSPAKGSLEAKVTIKDQCDDVFYKAVFAAKKDADPADCKDGQVQIASSTLVFFNGLESGATYHVRACAFTDEFTSVGVVKTVTMP